MDEDELKELDEDELLLNETELELETLLELVIVTLEEETCAAFFFCGMAPALPMCAASHAFLSSLNFIRRAILFSFCVLKSFGRSTVIPMPSHSAIMFKGPFSTMKS